MLSAGTHTPAWSGPNQHGEIKKHSDYLGSWLILFFYPKDMTPGCTAEACSLRDQYEDFLKAGYQVVGVSMDSEKRHQKFIDKYDLPYDLIADEDRSILEAFDVWGEKKFMGKTYDGIRRSTFIIDPEGTIQEVITKVKTKSHADQIWDLMESE